MKVLDFNSRLAERQKAESKAQALQKFRDMMRFLNEKELLELAAAQRAGNYELASQIAQPAIMRYSIWEYEQLQKGEID